MKIQRLNVGFLLNQRSHESLRAFNAELRADAGWIEAATLESLSALLPTRDLAFTLMPNPAHSLTETFAR